MPRIIIVEGVDKAGKSTLCKKLAEQMGMRLIHHSKPPEDPYIYFSHALENAKYGDVICDRHCLGEMIYSKIKGEPSQWKEHDYEKMLSQLEELRAVLFILWDDNDIIETRFKEDLEDYVSVDDIFYIQKMFLEEGERIAKTYPNILTFKVNVRINHYELLNV